MVLQQKTTLVMMRHGQSEWNKKNVFTGWVDVPLSNEGIAEAVAAQEQIRNIPIDVIFTSTLIRAQMTAMIAMIGHSSEKVPVIIHKGEKKLDTWSKIYSERTARDVIPTYTAWELNERMYGELQGCNKAETAEIFGPEQVKIWRRSYDIPPPNGESLKDTASRTIPYFRETIVPYLKDGQNVFISAHGNSLRSIIMDLDKLSKEQVLELELPTGQPIFYTFSNDQFEKQTS